jgi:hypothetical protein
LLSAQVMACPTGTVEFEGVCAATPAPVDSGPSVVPSDEKPRVIRNRRGSAATSQPTWAFAPARHQRRKITGPKNHNNKKDKT